MLSEEFNRVKRSQLANHVSPYFCLGVWFAAVPQLFRFKRVLIAYLTLVCYYLADLFDSKASLRIENGGIIRLPVLTTMRKQHLLSKQNQEQLKLGSKYKKFINLMTFWPCWTTSESLQAEEVRQDQKVTNSFTLISSLVALSLVPNDKRYIL